jgi:hypothetical protein
MPGLTRTRLTMLGTAALVALSSAGLVGLRRPTLRPTNLDFTVHYDGRGAENLDDIWRGELDDPEAGRIAIRIERPAPGPMHAFVFVSHDNVARSFGAEVRGDTTDSGTVHLRGTIDVGTATGARSRHH